MANNGDIYRKRRAARPKPKRQGVPKSFIIIFLLIIAGLGAIYALSSSDAPAPNTNGGGLSREALQKVIIPDEIPSITKRYTGFTINFNPSRHVPNYAVWELTGAETEGTTPRSSRFRTDDDVLGCATLEDYRHSGFDRGHMAPAGDMKWNEQAMADSHYLTNICPQDHAINSGRWSSLENKCRQWARRDSAIIIITGPILSDEITRTIGASQVAVPDRFFKVLLSPHVEPMRAIAFIIPNSATPDGLEQMTVPVDDIEAITGFDFFSELPDEIENKIESVANYRDWNRRKNKTK